METYLGIDGGGSTTRARLVDAKGNPIHTAESGPSNLNACDEATVRASLSDVIDQCRRATGTRPTATCLGLAGAGNTSTREKLESIIRSLDLGKTLIATDAEIALEGAFNGGPGLLLIAGTGSVCLGKSSDGIIHRAGGWGWLADDAGSAGWIGQRALEIAVQQNDGRMEGKALRDGVFEQLGIRCSEEISPKLYQPTLGRSMVAELSKCVLDLANQGDDAAGKIYSAAIDELEKLVRATAGKLHEDRCQVVLAGGLLTHHAQLRLELESRLSDFTFQEPASTQLEGAVALARRA